MSLTATTSGSTFTPAPAGTHLAICRQIIDIGHQYSTFYKKTKHKVVIGWELPEEKTETGEPFLVWKRYTLSLHEKSNLCGHLESWRGRTFNDEERKGFHLKNLLGKPCLLNLVHENDKTNPQQVYAQVKAVMAPPKGTKSPTPFHPEILFDIEEWNQAVFDGFRDNLKKTINESEERKGKVVTSGKVENHDKPLDVPGAAAEAAAGEDDIPF